MCGLTGYWIIKGFENDIQSNEVIRNMLSLQKHRGPDDSGIVGINTRTKYYAETGYEKLEFFNQNVDLFFGFNRLSILDLSKNGHQPMFSPDKKVLIVFNGEVYNVFGYKDELIERGHVFMSKTDTEVILHLYMEYGIQGMLHRLNGMFAIAIYDFTENKVYLTRDRFGIKPLYFMKNEKFFAFSSEIKSFKALPAYKLQLDKGKLDEFLLFRYVVKNTLFKDIISCQPGTYVEVDENGKTLTHTYYSIDNEGSSLIDGKKVQDILSATLQKSVKSQMISDVKLGCQLSGGIDSSLITYYASLALNKGQLETISIIFDDPEFSEKKWIDSVVTKLNLIDHQYTMKGDYFFSILERAIWHFEHPISHSNALGIYLLSKEAKKDVTVLLSGEGADECFGGYYKFLEPLDTRFKYLNRIVRQILKRKVKISDLDWDFILHASGEDNAFILTSAFSTAHSASSVYPDFSLKRALETRQKIMAQLTGEKFQKQRKYEILTYLPELLLRQDKMSMAHSIENRVPFLDNEVVSLSMKIPKNYLLVNVSKIDSIKQQETKFALKEICAQVFSDEFAFRTKLGFNIPEVEFMSTEPFKKLWNEFIKPGTIKRGIFNIDNLDNNMHDLSKLKPDILTTLFLLVGFEIWAQQYLD